MVIMNMDNWGYRKIVKTPTLLPNLNNIKSITKFGHITLLLTNNCEVYVIGPFDNQNIISVPNMIKDIASIKSNKNSVLFLDNDGNIYGYGELGIAKNFNTPKIVLKSSNIKQIELSNNYSFILRHDGKLLVAGGKISNKYVKRFTYFRSLKI
jgi:alpha-tubulin suppressor-like RCC1 family protein